MTDSLNTAAEKVGLQISCEKSKVSTVGATTATPTTIGQQTLEGVSEFQYLGSIISTESDVEVDIWARIGKAASTFQRLRKIWSNHSINLDTKLRLYTSIVSPTVLHACETWKSTFNIRQKLYRRFPPKVSPHYSENIMAWPHFQRRSPVKSWSGKPIRDSTTKEAEICGSHPTSAWKQTSL